MLKHPFLKGSNIIVYVAIWILIATIQSAIIYFYFGSDLKNAFTDGLIFSSVFAFIAVGLWYSIMYINTEHTLAISIIIIHVILAILSTLIWIVTSLLLIDIINPEYKKILTDIPYHITLRSIEGIFYYLVVILIYYLIIYYNRYKNKQYSESELKLKVQEAELSMLKSQINPHFLFNSLNSVNSLTITDPEKARQMLVKLSEFMRYSLTHDNRQQIPLEQEVTNIERYLDIEKVRFGNKIAFEKNIRQNASKALIPALILQPLIENAIKHGVYEATSVIVIKLDCLLTIDGLLLIMGNNFDPEALPRKGAGIGLRNISSRLELIFKRSDLINIKKTNNYFEVSLLIPQPT